MSKGAKTAQHAPSSPAMDIDSGDEHDVVNDDLAFADEDGDMDETGDEFVESEDFEEFDGDSEADIDDEEQGVPVDPANLPLINDDFTALSASAADTADPASLNPERPTPYIFDAGHLMVQDPNPLPKTTAAAREGVLAANARDAAQSLLNHLLTTCPIHSLPASSATTSGVVMTLPPPVYALPREKKVPVPKPPTKWEQFAAKKGIGKKQGGAGKNGELTATEGKLVYDEAAGTWVPKWGYKGKNKRAEGEWLVEVDDKKEAAAAAGAAGAAGGKSGKPGKSGAPAGDARAESRAAREEHVKRNERLQRANERRARGGKGQK